MISVIILSKNNGDTLDACLKSVVNSLGLKEIIVVDAHSSDNTPSILEKYKNYIKVVYDEGKGIGLARNIGVLHSKGDIICFVDADAFVSKDHFVKIKECFDRHREVGIVNVRVKEIVSDRVPYIQRMEAKIRLLREKSKTVFSKSEDSLATGYFISFRRKVFDDVGGFWEFPPFGGDDYDFQLKVLAKGWKMAWISLDSWHRHRISLKELLKEMWMWGKGKACFIIKWRKHPLVSVGFRRSFVTKLIKEPMLLAIVAYVFSPFLAVKYTVASRSLSIYPYYVVRQYAFLFGFLWGLNTWAKKLVKMSGHYSCNV
jgi:glycosyltransferase involved in cell wall biosynthesis